MTYDLNNTSEVATFFVAGHIYGSPENKGDPTVSSTLINAIDLINEVNPDFFFSLGDMVYLPSDEGFKKLEEDFLDKINSPINNTPGNHDLKGGRKLYEEYFGQTYFSFFLPHNAIIILDSNIAYCYIDGYQRNMLDTSIKKAISDQEINSIFILTHHPIFLDGKDDLFNRTNDRCAYGTNFNVILEDILIPAAGQKPLYLIAGDVGAFDGSNLSPYYYKYPNVDLYTIAIGLGDGSGDALLQISTDNKNITIDIISLNNKEFSNIETYDPEYYYSQPK